MIYLLDTNTLSQIARGRNAHARARLTAVSARDVLALSVMTEAEVRYGLAKRPEAHALRAVMEKLMQRLRILNWSGPEAAAYAELRVRLESQGQMLSTMDLLIAAQARAAGAVLVTSDRAFWQLEGVLALEDWGE